MQAKGGKILLNQAVVGISQAQGSNEPKTLKEIDALTTDEVYLDTNTEKAITKFLDMVSGAGDILWLQEKEGEEARERAESPSGGQSTGVIVELADAVRVELS